MRGFGPGTNGEGDQRRLVAQSKHDRDLPRPDSQEARRGVVNAVTALCRSVGYREADQLRLARDRPNCHRKEKTPNSLGTTSHPEPCPLSSLPRFQLPAHDEAQAEAPRIAKGSWSAIATEFPPSSGEGSSEVVRSLPAPGKRRQSTCRRSATQRRDQLRDRPLKCSFTRSGVPLSAITMPTGSVIVIQFIHTDRRTRRPCIMVTRMKPIPTQSMTCNPIGRLIATTT